VPALARTLSGRSRVAGTLHNWVRQMMRVPDLSLRGAEVNGAPGILILDGRERLFSVWGLDIAGGEIVGIDAIVNPDKLRHLGPVADYEELRSSRE
jgi:RNA polymerase sigma-70 factor (ECF subfamily)